MRRWSGAINNLNIVLILEPHVDNDGRLNMALANTPDNFCRLLAQLLLDISVPNNSEFTWITNNDEINHINNRAQVYDDEVAHYLLQHHLRIESIFTFVTMGPGPRGRRPIR